MENFWEIAVIVVIYHCNRMEIEGDLNIFEYKNCKDNEIQRLYPFSILDELFRESSSVLFCLQYYFLLTCCTDSRPIQVNAAQHRLLSSIK